MLVKSVKAELHITHLAEAFQVLKSYNMKLNPAKCAFEVSAGKFLGFIVNNRGIEANPDMSHPESRSDPIGGSESSSGREIIYWDSLPALSDVGISKSYNYINITYTKVQNKTTTVVVFTVSHIQY